MQLPSKLYSYKESSLFLIPYILKELGNKKLRVDELYRLTRKHVGALEDFISAMDCAYALRAIDMNEEGEVYRC